MSFGSFQGDVVAKWLQHEGADRDMELLENFAFTDAEGTVWKAPQGSVVNGASIPAALWNSVGPPFVGDYRRASVVHDVACVERKRPHEDVHRMFYDAMRTDDVGWTKANVMYQAVKRFGPRWTASTGRLQRKSSRASDEDVLAFAEAVEEASKQIDEEQGLDAVEIKADQLLAQRLADDDPTASQKKSGKRSRGKSRRVKSVSAIKIRDSSAESADEEPGTMAAALQSVEPLVRKELAGSRYLHSFRLDKRRLLTPAVRSFAGMKSLADAGQGAALMGESEDGLSDADRLALVDQALVLLEENYVHRPLKESLYAINPVQKLKLLREELLRDEQQRSFQGDLGFHRELLSVFLSTRDLHTNYLLPSPFRETTAYLPFLVEDYFDRDDDPSQRRFLVTRVVGGMPPAGFRPGVELTRWNGVPIERAVEINGERFAGSNQEASRARGLETLTVRPLMQALPPEEDFVLVEYKTADGEVLEARFDWIVFTPDTGGMPAFQDLDELTATAQGIDIEQAMVRWAKRLLFAPEAVAAAAKMAQRRKATQAQGLQSLMPDVLEARSLSSAAGEYGYLRIRTFSVNSADSFVREVIRLIEQLPQEGLVIDVRGNGGGLILAGEQLLQLFTPRAIQPTLFQLITTPLNRQLVENVGFLQRWRESMRHAVQTGARFSQGFPITSPAKANEIGQRYHGPVALITDALCYSTTDIFAAGFQDHAVGTIIGIDNNTGAGGANVWAHGLLSNLMSGVGQSPYRPLPSNAAMRVSMRRTIRVGDSNGTVLEDFGVMPDVLHPMSRDDLLNANVDLLDEAMQILAEQPVRSLLAEIVEASDDRVSLRVETAGMDRLDIYDGGRPLGSVELDDAAMELSLSDVESDQLRLLGFEDGSLVASRVVSVDGS